MKKILLRSKRRSKRRLDNGKKRIREEETVDDITAILSEFKITEEISVDDIISKFEKIDVKSKKIKTDMDEISEKIEKLKNILLLLEKNYKEIEDKDSEIAINNRNAQNKINIKIKDLENKRPY